MQNDTNRRGFLKSTTAAAAGAALTSTIANTAHAAGSDLIRFGLIGCGGRGSSAAGQIMNTKGNTKLVAVADAFPDIANKKLELLTKRHQDKVDVPQDRLFGGLDGYKRVVDSDVDLVIIATPPAFKPQQFEYAVNKGKHVFMEKPVASDATGVKRVLASVEESKKKNLMVAIGLQRRHEPRYVETIDRIHDGAIGDITTLRVYWNGQSIWYRIREPHHSEIAFQTHNWYHFNWLSGDQICEQHIHNLDVGCWVKGEYPVECNGMGGRDLRLDGDASKSQIFDHTFCEYTFADGSKMYSQGRHVRGAWNHVAEAVHGTKGNVYFQKDPQVGHDPKQKDFPIITGENAWAFTGERPQGHQQEQHDMIEALMRGEIYNEGEYGAKSTFTAILGREACYSGKIVKWDELLEKGRELAPGIDDYTFDSPPPPSATPDENGLYPVPVPGKYNPFA